MPVVAATETQPSHDDWDKVVMNITTEDKSMNDNDQYESLRGLSLRQLREAKQVRAVHRSMAPLEFITLVVVFSDICVQFVVPSSFFWNLLFFSPLYVDGRTPCHFNSHVYHPHSNWSHRYVAWVQ